MFLKLKMTRIKSFYQYLILQVSDLSCNLSSILPFYSRSVDSQLFTLETNNESRRLFRIKSRIGYSRILRGCKRRWHELYTYSTVYFHLLLQTFKCLGSPPDTMSNIISCKYKISLSPWLAINESIAFKMQNYLQKSTMM